MRIKNLHKKIHRTPNTNDWITDGINVHIMGGRFHPGLYLEEDGEVTFYRSNSNEFALLTSKELTDEQVLNYLNKVTFENFIEKYELDYSKGLFPVEYAKYSVINSFQEEVNRAERRMDEARSNFLNYSEKVSYNKFKKKVFEDNYHKIPFTFSKVHDMHIFTVRNIVCEDTCFNGKSFPIKRLVFGISFLKNKIVLLDGSLKGVDGYIRGSLHPHHIGSDGHVCLGSLGVDVTEAIRNFEFDVLKVLIRQFASSYTSKDSAGQSYKAFVKAANALAKKTKKS